MSIALAQQADLNSETGRPAQSFTVTAPEGSPCTSSTPGIIIHDDNSAENGYGWQPTVTDGRYVEKFTPTTYPATFSSVCFALITNAGVTSMPFDIVVYAADGAGGAPGTVLGTKSVTGNVTSIAGLPFTPTFQAFDISSLALNVTSGSVYIGLKWVPSTVSGVFIAADQSSATPIAGGYSWANTGPWQTTQTGQASYRALMIRAVQGAAGTTPIVSKSFSPATVISPNPSTLTITLSNPVATAAALQSDLVDTFPSGLVVAASPAATTTCTGTLTAAPGSSSVKLASGATIPASGSCTIVVPVTVPTITTAGDYVNTIPAGALHTNQGDNATAATASLHVFPPGGNGVVHSPSLNHAVQQSVGGTSLNIVSNAFDDSGPISGDWDFNFWASSNTFTFYTISTHNTAYVVDSTGKAVVLQNGDTVGPSSTFSTSSSVSAAAAWLAGVDGAVGVKFDCNNRLTYPVPSGVCYGYVRIQTTGPSGFPATIVDTTYDGDGNPITFNGNAPGNPPAATVTPSSLSFSVMANATATQTLNVANAAGSDPLTYSIAARGTSNQPRLLPHAKSKVRSTNPNIAPKLEYLESLQHRSFNAIGGVSSAHQQRAPWAPVGPDGSTSFILDDGTIEGHIGLNNAPDGNESFAAVWLNRFSATGALTIDSISIYWPGPNSPNGASGLTAGMQPNLVVYYDAAATGNPANAVRVGTDKIVTISTLDGAQTYPTNFSIPGAGDVYIGFVDQWALVEGGYSGILFPAAIDQTASHGQSWVSAGSSALTDIVDLANNDMTAVIDSFGPTLAGNWMIRATGTAGGGGGSCTGPIVNWLTATPSSGSVNGGASASVTVKADPAAGSLAPGSYTAELCLTTNDTQHALISVPVALTVTAPPFVPCSGGSDEIFCDGFDGSGGPFTQPIQDPSFEATTGDGESNPFWTGTDSNSSSGGTPFYSANLGEVHTGNFAAWGGGWRIPGTQSWSQSVTIASGGPRYLNYWRNVVLAPNGTATLTISIDGTAVSTTDIVANGQDPDWTNVSVDLSSYADNAAHTLKFAYTTTGSEDGNCFVDDVTIDDHQGSTRRASH